MATHAEDDDDAGWVTARRSRQASGPPALGAPESKHRRQKSWDVFTERLSRRRTNTNDGVAPPPRVFAPFDEALTTSPTGAVPSSSTLTLPLVDSATGAQVQRRKRAISVSEQRDDDLVYNTKTRRTRQASNDISADEIVIIQGRRSRQNSSEPRSPDRAADTSPPSDPSQPGAFELAPGTDQALAYAWEFWFDESAPRGVSQVAYESAICSWGAFDTIVGFWKYWRAMVDVIDLPSNCNLRMFKRGIKPLWEDPANVNGGRYVVSIDSNDLEVVKFVWAELVLSLVGDQLTHGDDICGIVLQMRPSRTSIAVWNSNSARPDIVAKTTEEIVHFGNLPPGGTVAYQVNETAMTFNKTFAAAAAAAAGESAFRGILAVFADLEPSVADEPAPPPFSSPVFRVYRSSQRDLALRLCNWQAAASSVSRLERLIATHELDGKFDKAAALALFHLDLRRAIMALNKQVGDKGEIPYEALALAGFQDGGSSVWAEMARSLQSKFPNPYVRAMFAFLSSNGDGFRGVFEETGMSLTDRIAFACRFLPDDQLVALLQKTARDLVSRGELEGVLLTGLSPLGIELFTAYIDRTSDVQTGALAMSLVVPREFESEVVAQWIEIYSELLDRWQLWHQRAQMDVARLAGTEPKGSLAAQVHARCNFCDKSLAHTMINSSKLRQWQAGQAGPTGRLRPRATACPNCTKPLPKCALCLLPLEVVATASMVGADAARRSLTKLQAGSSVFDQWFTWCQTCRHGGHAAHMDEWFMSHSQCPVSECECHCALLDGPSPGARGTAGAASL
eukprot:c32551_g1_i1.p1 GENE.c32551_g1_i1~~c32551_g1_i1.p1  ORF type:complete len:792 (+),score=109.86 c32551_g1_i1:103-2478(+)